MKITAAQNTFNHAVSSTDAAALVLRFRARYPDGVSLLPKDPDRIDLQRPVLVDEMVQHGAASH